MPPPNPPLPYRGPTFLTASKYASPQLIKTRPATEPPALAITKPVADATIATKEQIAAANSTVASNVSVQGVNAQLAIELSSTLKKDVDNYVAKYSSTVSSAVANARQLLDLIRKTMSAADLQAVDQMWTELEQLFTAVNDAKIALPLFLEKQKNNMSLYHASLLNEAIRENQEELNLQHKKVNLQHNLILEQQQGFQEYKTQAETRLQDVQQLHDRVSRLTLEKGNLRTEIDRYQLLLEQEISEKSNELEKAESLQKEYTLLSASKAALQAENDTLRTSKDEITKKLSTAEQSITDRFTTEIKLKTEELSKSKDKIATLDTLINTLKAREAMAKKEADKAKEEYNSTKEKYNQQSTEYADASMKLKEKTKEAAKLAKEVEDIRQETTGLKNQLRQTKELEDEIKKLSQNKSDLSQQLDALTLNFLSAKDDAARAKRALSDLAEQSKGTEQTQNTIELLKAENSRLKKQTDGLEGQTADASPVTVPGDYQALNEKIRKLEHNQDGWMKVAKESYKRYTDILPAANEAEKLRQDAQSKDAEISNLKERLTASKVAQSNGEGSDSNAKYWKNKYETLLASV